MRSLFFAFLVCSSVAVQATGLDYESKSEITSRLESLDLKVPIYYSSPLQSRLNEYFKRDLRPTQEMLTRMVQYFPEIERALREAGLPESLKYMVVEESRIDPLAVSGDGAVGLWQFMPATAREHGLVVNDLVDERRNVTKSTKAAIKYLKELYARYEDWALVMAAYNGGVTRLNRVIRTAGSKKWSVLRQHLPREMARFIPRYLASAYVCNFYRFHGLEYNTLNLDLLITETIHVSGNIKLAEIAEKCHLPTYIIYQLNPQYKRSFLPDSTQLYTINIPSRVVVNFKERLNIKDYSIDNKTREDIIFYKPADYYIKSMYVSDGKQDLIELSDTLGVDPYIVKYYNNLNSLSLPENQSIHIVSMK